jgi:hypothetical protein
MHHFFHIPSHFLIIIGHFVQHGCPFVAFPPRGLYSIQPNVSNLIPGVKYHLYRTVGISLRTAHVFNFLAECWEQLKSSNIKHLARLHLVQNTWLSRYLRFETGSKRPEICSFAPKTRFPPFSAF